MSHRGYTITKQIRLERRKEAETRQAEYDKLTLEEKIAKLPPEPFSAKQRARLMAQLEEKLKGPTKKVEEPLKEADKKPYQKPSKQNRK
jgi:hypothetical protein